MPHHNENRNDEPEILPVVSCGILLIIISILFTIISIAADHSEPFTIIPALLGAMVSFRIMVSARPNVAENGKSAFFSGLIGLSICFICLMLQNQFSTIQSGALHDLLDDTLQEHFDPIGTQIKLSRSTREDLTKIFTGLQDYAAHAGNSTLPPLSTQPGRLMYAAFGKSQDERHSPYIAQSDPDYNRLWSQTTLPSNTNFLVDDWSFFYLGYEIHSDEEMAAFAVVYKTRIQDGLDFTGDLPAPSFPDNVIKRLRLIPFNIKINNQPSIPPLYTIPVLIERIENNKMLGGNVLFLDGHVEFMPYPGKWPMTEKTIQILNALDQMGPRPGEHP